MKSLASDSWLQTGTLRSCPPDPDYSCGAAFCDDPACNTHNPNERGDTLLMPYPMLKRCSLLVHLSHEMDQEERDWRLAQAAERLRLNLLNQGVRPFGRVKTRWMNPNKYWFLDEDCAELTCLALPVVLLDPTNWRLEWLAS